MKAITYQIELLEPVLVTALDGDPNSSVSFRYLPGSVLRGAIISRFMQKEDISDLDIQNDKIRRLFFSGSTRFLNGYIIDRLKNRSLPTPLSWKQNKKSLSLQTKHQPAPVHDFSVRHLDGEWKNTSNPFCYIENDKVRLMSPMQHLAIHTQRDRDYGRPRTDSGAIYRYEALAAGQIFKAVILCDHDADAENLHLLLNGEVALGGSRTGGYGWTKLSSAEIETTWRETEKTLSVISDEKLVITLLSDAIVRGEYGQYASSVDGLIRAIGKKLKVPNGDTLSTSKVFCGRTLIGGFNRKWGLPLPQASAIQMGSVVIIEPRNWDLAKLQTLEEQGIGERRAEGFGRLAINWLSTEKETWNVENIKDDDKPAPVPISENSTGQKIALRMVERMLRQRLDGELIQWVNRTRIDLRNISNSQISRLRMLLRDALQYADNEDGRIEQRKRLTAYLDTLPKRRTTRDQFQDQKVMAMPFLKWSRERINDKDGQDHVDKKKQITKNGLWGGKILNNPSSPVIGDVTFELQPKLENGQSLPEPNQQLVYEYNLRLVDAVLKRAAKEQIS